MADQYIEQDLVPDGDGVHGGDEYGEAGPWAPPPWAAQDVDPEVVQQVAEAAQGHLAGQLAEQQVQALYRDFPNLGDDGVMREMLTEAQQRAERHGDPGMATDPDVWRDILENRSHADAIIHGGGLGRRALPFS